MEVPVNIHGAKPCRAVPSEKYPNGRVSTNNQFGRRVMNAYLTHQLLDPPPFKDMKFHVCVFNPASHKGKTTFVEIRVEVPVKDEHGRKCGYVRPRIFWWCNSTRKNKIRRNILSLMGWSMHVSADSYKPTRRMKDHLFKWAETLEIKTPQGSLNRELWDAADAAQIALRLESA